MLKTDVLVLGAGIVGVAAALQIQARGREVVLVDRRGAGEETSFGNAGIIERASVFPYPFPRDLQKLAVYAVNGAMRRITGSPICLFFRAMARPLLVGKRAERARNTRFRSCH